jgi:hypothetical protein
MTGPVRLPGETVTVRRLLTPLTLLAITALAAPAVAQTAAFPAPLPNQSATPAPSAAPAKSAQPQFPPVNQSSAPAQGTSAFPPVSGSGAPPPRAAAASPFPSPTGAAASQGVFQQGAGVPPVTAAGFGPGGGPPRANAEQEECMAKFAPLRADAEKRAKMIQSASARKATAQEACTLIKAYVAAEKKVVDYVTTKQTACGIPSEIPTQLKGNQSKSQEMMKQVCAAAANQAQGGGGGPAAAPSLSEVLGTSNASAETRTVPKGGSTFDTINGNVLTR